MTHQTLTTLKHSIEADNLEGVAKLLAQDAGRLDFLGRMAALRQGRFLPPSAASAWQTCSSGTA